MATKDSTQAAVSPDKQAAADTGSPIVVETKKKKKRRYSNILWRSLQELEEGATKSSRKVSKAVREALDSYSDARDKSAGKKRNGAFRDILRNQSKALRKGLPIAAEAPSDFIDEIADMKAVRRVLGR